MILVGAILLAIYVLEMPWSAVVVGAAAVVEVAETLFWIWLSRRGRVQMGPETLVGATAQVVADCLPRGQVRVQGELWGAYSAQGATAGDRVRIHGLEGLTLLVERE